MKVDKYYDQLWKEQWDLATESGPSCRTRFRLMYELFEKYNLQGDVLDVGCGDGNFLARVARLGGRKNNLYGFDISKEAVRLAKKRKFISQIFVGDLLMPETLPKKQFDVVVCSEVIEHIDEWENALSNMSALVKKNGHVLITVPYDMEKWTVHDTYAHHYRRYEKGQMEKELKKNGFNIVESFTWGSFFYRLYYWFLARTDPRKVMSKKRKSVKKGVGAMLYRLFKFDDHFKGWNGRRLFVLARKK